MKKQIGPTEILFPVPAALITSGTLAQPNIITIAWISMISNEPPTIGFVIMSSRYSLELIKVHKCFGVNIPSAKHFVEADYCGIVSGRKVNKFEKTGFTVFSGKKVKVPLIQECPFNLECKLTKIIKINKNRLLILGQIFETHVDADKVVDAKKFKLDIKKIDPLVYCARVREYWSIGKKLGDGYSAGKVLLK